MSRNLARVKVKVSSTIQSRVETAVREHIVRRLGKVADRIEHNGGTILSRAVKHTRTYEGLQDTSGVVGQDLQAEFGLKEEEAARALRRLDWVVKNYGVFVTSREITKLSTTKRGKSAAEFRIWLFSRSKRSHPGQGRSNANRRDYYQMLTKSNLFRYTSRPKVQEGSLESPVGSPQRIRERIEKQKRTQAHEIEWMRWILDGRITRNIRLSLRLHGIKYKLVGSQEKAASRSGRAIMTTRKFTSYYTKKSERRGTDAKGMYEDVAAVGFPYQFPEAAKARAGYKNFLEEAAGNASVQSKIKEMAKKVVLSELKSPASLSELRYRIGRPRGSRNTTDPKIRRSGVRELRGYDKI